jgi:hypothetical protein
MNMPQTAMTVSDLLWLHRRAWLDRPAILGEPEGGFTPAEAAGALVAGHGLDKAREIARERAGEFPGPWNFHERVYRILEETVDA